MKIYTKKLKNPKLKKIINKDGTKEEEVLIEDVKTNVLEEGTPITDSVLANINFKDNETLEFSLVENPINVDTNKALLYATKEGKLYCVISGYKPFELNGITLNDVIKKKGITYVMTGPMEYFNLGSSMKLFSTETKVGTIPKRLEETNDIANATYLNFSEDEIKGLVKGSEKLKIQNNNIKLINNNTLIEMDSNDKIKLKSGTNELNIDNSRFMLKSPTTELGVDSTYTKLNCHTSLHKASYGNQNFRLQFEDTVKLKNMNTTNNLISVKPDGTILIGNETLTNLIERLAMMQVDKFSDKKVLFNGAEEKVYLILDDEDLTYYVYFSEEKTSEILNIKFKRKDIKNYDLFYNSETKSYYRYVEILAYDDSEDDYTRIDRVDSEGRYIKSMYIRRIYAVR